MATGMLNDFRSLMTAASLKRHTSLASRSCLSDFRSLMTAASLKPVRALDVRAAIAALPQSHDCGLIEASALVPPAVIRHDFRSLMTAASLKR